MTEKPDYMQMAIEAVEAMAMKEHSGGGVDMMDHWMALATTLEALDTERTAHEATMAELQALREAGIALLRRVEDYMLGAVRASSAAEFRDFRALLPQPTADPLVACVKEAAEQMGTGDFAQLTGYLRSSLARHGLTITEKQG